MSALRGLGGWVFKALPPCWGFRSSARARAAPLQHVYLLCGVCLLCRTLACCSSSAAVNVNLEGAHRGPYSPGSQGRCVPTAAQPRGVRGPWKLLNPCSGCREPDTVEDLWFVVFFFSLTLFLLRVGVLMDNNQGSKAVLCVAPCLSR